MTLVPASISSIPSVFGPGLIFDLRILGASRLQYDVLKWENKLVPSSAYNGAAIGFFKYQCSL